MITDQSEALAKIAIAEFSAPPELERAVALMIQVATEEVKKCLSQSETSSTS